MTWPRVDEVAQCKTASLNELKRTAPFRKYELRCKGFGALSMFKVIVQHVCVCVCPCKGQCDHERAHEYASTCNISSYTHTFTGRHVHTGVCAHHSSMHIRQQELTRNAYVGVTAEIGTQWYGSTQRYAFGSEDAWTSVIRTLGKKMRRKVSLYTR